MGTSGLRQGLARAWRALSSGLGAGPGGLVAPAGTQPGGDRPGLAATATAPPIGRESSLLLRLFEQAGAGLLICSADGRVRLCSPVAAELLAAEPESVCGEPIARWVSQLIDLSRSDEYPVLASGQWETMALRADGSEFPVELTVTDGRVDGLVQWVVIMRDITDRKLTQERFTRLATLDALTGLPNRTLFRERLGQAVARARRSGVSMALMFLDLDNFKDVNDTLGHAVGDEMLRIVAQRLEHCLLRAYATSAGAEHAAGANFTIARLGGDEFTVIAENLPARRDAESIAHDILGVLAQPLRLGEHELPVSASIGIAMLERHNLDLDGLVRNADLAMYRAKEMGRGTFAFYSVEMSAEAAERLRLESDLRRALQQGEFSLVYQPKARLLDGEVTGVEALLRWQPPGRRPMPAGRVIDALERSGLILEVGAWVLRTACDELSALQREGFPPLTLAVNVSARQLRQPQLARLIADTLAETGFAPAQLEIELTERLLIEDSETTRGALAALAQMGVRVAMDDFGTGHSSLSQLKRFDIDTLKIDKSFVDALPDDAEDRAIATAIVAMGHSLHMRVVAEGVETPEQALCLAGLGCDEMQGYLLSRPLSLDRLRAWLKCRPAAPSRGSSAATGGTRWRDPASDNGPFTLLALQGLEAEPDGEGAAEVQTVPQTLR